MGQSLCGTANQIMQLVSNTISLTMTFHYWVE